MRLLPLLVLFGSVAAVRADEPIRLAENSQPGSEFRVVAESTISGELLAPVEKGKPPQRIPISGKSSIDYAERILPVEAKEADYKSLRVYERMDFKKTTGDRTDEATLRLAVRRLVMMKKGHSKVPFSPDGPLMWSEIDLIRTDFVVPALASLLPGKPVSPGDTWKAGEGAIVELTDWDKIDKGELTCTLDKVLVAGPRKVAQVTFTGTLHGVNEDGPARQKITGRLLVDLGTECITFLKIEGEHYLLDGDGKEAGKITGTFELSRAPMPGHPAIAEKVVKGLELTPSEENTRLLYDSEEMGVRFVHSRNWRVVRTNGRQITLDESDGSGLLITLDAPGSAPLASDYLKEAIRDLRDRGAKLTNRIGPDKLADGVERFTIDAVLGKEKVVMDYVVVRQDKGAATLAARVPAELREVRMKELERLARSFTITRRLDGK
jgi:hypothetical protein